MFDAGGIRLDIDEAAWQVVADGVVNDLMHIAQQKGYLVQRVMEAYADEIGPEMQANAPWTDRTGNARRSLFSRTEETDDGTWQLRLGYDHILVPIPYWIFLERMQAGRFAIVEPTYLRYLPEIARTIREVTGVGIGTTSL